MVIEEGPVACAKGSAQAAVVRLELWDLVGFRQPSGIGSLGLGSVIVPQRMQAVRSANLGEVAPQPIA